MKLLPKFFLAVLLLTVTTVTWAACPEGQKQTYKGCEGVVSESEPEQEPKEEYVTPSGWTRYDLHTPDEWVRNDGTNYGVSWFTTPRNTQQAIDYYFKGRELDPIEGIWTDRHAHLEIIIVKNTFGVAPKFDYLVMLTHYSGNTKREVDFWSREFGRAWFEVKPGLIITNIAVGGGGGSGLDVLAYH